MSTINPDKPLSEATIGEVEAMLERVFMRVALFAVTQNELEKRALWLGESYELSQQDINARVDYCEKAIASNQRPVAS